MEKNYSTMVEKTINALNWDLILTCYQAVDKVPNRFSERKKLDKNQLKKEIKELIYIVIDSNIKHLDHENWVINWDEQHNRLEVAFCPVRSISRADFADESDEPNVVDYDPDRELNDLRELLVKYEKEEKYERCAAINISIKKLLKRK